MTVNGVAGPSFTPATFLSSLNTALGGAATASFSNGALSLSATASGSGVAIADDATAPAQDGGQGFSQFFGLNDLITSSGFTNYNTGLQATDFNGFNAGGSITLQIADQTGAPVTNVTVAVPAGGTMQDLVNALNAPVGGVGLYGAFSLNANGALAFAPTTLGGASIAVVSDSSQRGTAGPSMSTLFGIGVAAQASRATSYQIRSDISADPSNMALGTLDLSVSAGEPAVAIGDGSGAIALAAVANANTKFGAAGALAAINTSVTQYSALLAGNLSQRASSADSASTAASAVQSEASTRLQSATGVNLDQELVNLTTYQQAYSASAQLINASKSMYATLLNMLN
jgi:flagellar hook-associated protein 1 FlgK